MLFPHSCDYCCCEASEPEFRKCDTAGGKQTCSVGEVSLDTYCLWECIFNSWNHAPCIVTGVFLYKHFRLWRTFTQKCMSSYCILQSISNAHEEWMVHLTAQSRLDSRCWMRAEIFLCCPLEEVFENISTESQMKMLLHQRIELWDSFALEVGSFSSWLALRWSLMIQ